ncbi:MAG: PAS domain S-box protein [Halobacteriota archaeon]
MATDTPINVLLIEDNPTDVRLVQELLRGAPSDQFNIITASSLAEGLQHISADRVDAILLDLGLPDSQGLDSFRAVEEHARDLPIIILTVSTDEELGRKIVLEGAQQFFSKDVLTPDGAYAEMFPRMIRFAIERKRIEAALARSERRYRQLVDTANVIILRADPQLTITYCNDYTLKLLGYTADEFIGKPAVGTLLPPTESTGRDLAKMAHDVVDHPERYEHNRNEVLTKGGRRLLIEWTNAPQFDEEGNYTGVLSTGIDITERVAAETAPQAEAAARTQARDAALLNKIIKHGNTTTDAQDFLQYVCDVLTTDLGYDAVDMRILSDNDDRVAEQIAVKGFPAEFNEQFRYMSIDDPILRDAYRGEPYFPSRYAKTHADLVRITNLASVGIVPLVVGEKVIGDTGVALKDYRPFSRDEQALLVAIGREAGTVVARLQAEGSIKEQAELLNLANDAIVVRTLDHHIIFWNKGAEALFGWTQDEAKGKRAPTLMQVVYPTSLEAAHAELLKTGHWRGEVEATTKSGEKRHLEQNWTLKRDNNGNAVAILNIIRDVTERHRAEEKLAHYSEQLEDLVEERTAQLKDAERLAGIGETAAMIGHDLRNPLQGLQYIVDLQKLRFERLPPDKRTVEDWEKEKALFDRISEQVFYMDKIVGDLQDFARPITPEHEEIPLNTVINDALESLPSADDVEVALDVGDLIINADPHFMHRVFANLFLNAMQAMPHGGTLTISAKADDGSVAIHVTDTGTGIPTKMRDKIFSPLTTGKAKGTGLGLAVVKRIVEAHNGTITFASEERVGTTFTITLPQTAD